MIGRRRAIGLALAAAVLAAVPAAARAQQGFARFVPFLVDLPGWIGDKPDGLELDVPGSSIVSATREYRRGEARLGAAVVTGPTAAGAAAAAAANVDVDTGGARMRAGMIDGLAVARSFTVHDKSGIILVALGANAMFSLRFNGVAEDEALALARQFDWKAIQAAVPK